MEEITNLEVDWVQCDDCQKWRRLPHHIGSPQIGETWVCAQNNWDGYNNCTIPQEKTDEEIDSEIKAIEDAREHEIERSQKKRRKKS